jgi:hypothetical protein
MTSERRNFQKIASQPERYLAAVAQIVTAGYPMSKRTMVLKSYRSLTLPRIGGEVEDIRAISLPLQDWVMAGSEDRQVPVSMVRENFERYARSKAVTEFLEFPDRSHLIAIQDGWQEGHRVHTALAGETGRKCGIAKGSVTSQRRVLQRKRRDATGPGRYCDSNVFPFASRGRQSA